MRVPPTSKSRKGTVIVFSTLQRLMCRWTFVFVCFKLRSQRWKLEGEVGGESQRQTPEMEVKVIEVWESKGEWALEAGMRAAG